MILIQLARQLPGPRPQLILQPGVGQPGRLIPVQPARDLGEQPGRRGERTRRPGAHARPPLRAARRARSSAIPASAAASSSARARW